MKHSEVKFLLIITLIIVIVIINIKKLLFEDMVEFYCMNHSPHLSIGEFLFRHS